ncbi:kinase-like domain-containing protein, partial [Thamnocephalis sphaerospora]
LREDEAGDEVGGYVLGCELSRGSFSTVREAYHIEETKVKIGPVVVKIVRKHNIESAEEAMRRELMIWRRLGHPHVLPLLDSFESPMALYAVSPRCTKGNLLQLLNRMCGDPQGAGGLPFATLKRIALQLCSAVRYLHYDAAVAHGDLKLENALLDADENVRLIDFGLSRELFNGGRSSHNQEAGASARGCGSCTAAGSLPYCAPELLRGGLPDRPADCWALGVMLYACLVGRLPFQDAYEPRLVYKIVNAQYELP